MFALIYGRMRNNLRYYGLLDILILGSVRFLAGKWIIEFMIAARLWLLRTCLFYLCIQFSYVIYFLATCTLKKCKIKIGISKATDYFQHFMYENRVLLYYFVRIKLYIKLVLQKIQCNFLFLFIKDILNKTAVHNNELSTSASINNCILPAFPNKYFFTN